MAFLSKVSLAVAAMVMLFPHAYAADGVTLKRAYVDNRYGQLHYQIATPTSSQAQQHTPLVLFHQTANTSLEFGKLIPEMGRDRTVIAIDTPGYGGSDGPKSSPTINDYMLAIGEGLRNMGYGPSKPVDVLGYHTGAFTAIELSIAEPKMVRKTVLAGVWLVNEEQRLKAIAGTPRYNTSVEFFQWFANSLPRLQQSALAKNASDEDWGLVIADSLRPVTRREYGHDAAYAYGAVLRQRAPLVTQPVLLMALGDTIFQATLDSKPLFQKPTVVELPHLPGGSFFTAAPELGVTLRKFLD